MIDHLLGRPSTRLRKYQVFAVVLLWSIFLTRTDQHGPAPIRSISRYLSRKLTIWRTTVIFFLGLYVSRNFARVVGLESPEPLANLYTRSYFRATWVTTALDAGYWTAMHLRPDALRQVASLVFTVYYLVCAEQADELVRRVRGGLTLQHLRVSWDKPETGLLAGLTRLLRHKTGMMRRQPRRISIPRPKGSSYSESVDAWLYYDQPDDELTDVTKIIFDVPGGGFVAMSPRCHEDKLLAWAGRTKLPIIALNYRKAPEHPYPYALNECYDAYHSIMRSKGKCIGLSGKTMPKVVVTGDSAGGNLATAMILMLLQESSQAPYITRSRDESTIPLPEALVAIYPALDMTIKSWMTDEQMSLMRRPERRKTNSGVLRRKSEDYRTLTPTTPQGSDEEDDDATEGVASRSSSQLRTNRSATKSSTVIQHTRQTVATVPGSEQNQGVTIEDGTTAPRMRTRLAISSIISYFNDRVLSPEMLRSMIILYIGPYNRPDFQTDFLLSPILAPEQLLMRFPKVYLLTGERDPLVDDTVVFAGRLRLAHEQRFRERQELGLISSSAEFDESQHVEYRLIPGISHGFLQFVSVFPEGWNYIFQCDRWIRDAFQAADDRELESLQAPDTAFPSSASLNAIPLAPSESKGDYFSFTKPTTGSTRHHHRTKSGDDRPLEMGKSASSSPNSRRVQSGAGAIRKPHPHAASAMGRRSPISTRRSLVRLASTEDLMGRRMGGLTANMLGGNQEAVRTP